MSPSSFSESTSTSTSTSSSSSTSTSASSSSSYTFPLAQQVDRTKASFYLRSAGAGSIAAAFTHFVMVPVDVVKTRLQVKNKM